MTEPLLKIENLTSGYGDVQVLWGIDLEVREGEIACIVGSNGAGKTTLLRTISGLVKAGGGAVTFDGADITGASPDQVLGRGISHAPEGRRLFRGLSVRDNLLLGAYLRKGDKIGIENDLDTVFEVFPILRDRRNQDATTLSGGEQQMCSIGRAIMSRPKLLMIDELSLGLAPQAVERISEALLDVNKKEISILLVEQDVMTAFELASHAFVVETGRVTNKGRTQELADDPEIRRAYMGI